MTTGISPRITNRAQLRGKIVLPRDIFMVILADGRGGVMLLANDEAEGPLGGLLQRSS